MESPRPTCPPESADPEAAPTVEDLRLWSLSRTPGAGHYILGLRTDAGGSVSVRLQGADILSMAATVLDDGEAGAPPLPLVQ